jgi:hypothetical protein
VVRAILLALALLCPPLWLAAAILLPVVRGADYVATSALSAYVTNHAGRPLIVAALAGFSMLVNVSFLVVLVPCLRMMGGASATAASYVVFIGVAGSIFSRLSAGSIQSLSFSNWRFLIYDLSRLLVRHANHAR